MAVVCHRRAGDDACAHLKCIRQTGICLRQAGVRPTPEMVCTNMHCNCYILGFNGQSKTSLNNTMNQLQELAASACADRHQPSVNRRDQAAVC